ncbi:hypothetical protein Y032_0008g162 [Ancylostoma ceylanicum]|uniref:Secreted protein n=1 Tax=Ancylostoma ceylanicum TaxID=53326 RepID=A0A016VJZ5_9BILA|nr:hypothetical protein Y032_0008g162 [Ancylostoma ceylanicum]
MMKQRETLQLASILVVTTIQTSAVADIVTQQHCGWVAWRLRGNVCNCRCLDRGDHEETCRGIVVDTDVLVFWGCVSS